MNASNENHGPATADELHDRLIDVALREVVGKEMPPDLSAGILAAHNPQLAVSTRPATRSRRKLWVSLAVAAMLLVGATVALLPAMHSSHMVRTAAKASARLGNSTSQTSQSLGELAEAKESIPSPYYLADDVDEFAIASTTSAADPKADRYAVRDTSAIPTVAGEPTIAPARPQSFSSAYGGRAIEGEGRYGGYGGYGEGGAHQRQFKVEAAPGFRVHRYLDRFEAQSALGLNDGQAPAAGGLPAFTPEGTGPGLSGDQYTRIVENAFIKAEGGNAVSTFSIDVDTASYANVRQFLLEMNRLPPPDAVRIEELINYFDYDYAGPPADSEEPFAAHVEVAGCPWRSEHRLVRIGIQGREMDRQMRPRSNLVFLVDVSGSMNEPAKLPLVVYGLQQLARELGENDRVAIVVYASSEGLVLPSTPGSDQSTIQSALGRLQAGGSTAGGAGIQLAYQIAEDHFIEGGTNRVILCTDGDFNVGVTSTAELERLCETKAKDTRVFLSVLGFGRGNLNDAMMEAISNRGNGNYHYVDNRTEARRVLVEEMTGTLVTIAKDVKVQVEFNPRQVAGYRLIGYENRLLRTEDFNDDTKDAGEIGAGHSVTALYEIVPAGEPVDVPPVDDLKYQQPSQTADAEQEPDEGIRGELLTLKMRYKQPEGETSRKLEWAVKDEVQAFGEASGDYQFAAAVAGFGLLLRDSQHKGNLTYSAVLELAEAAAGRDEQGYRAEFVEMVRRAKALRGE